MKNQTAIDFILDFEKRDYPYLEEVNEGIVKQVQPASSRAAILDVGAGRGALGEALRNLGYEVFAIESNESAATEASSRVDRVICADLHDTATISASLAGKKFNYIVFSDVLEHVFDPLQVVRSYLAYLADDGRVLVSLPNAVNWLNRMRFLFGKFNYEMTGVMDRTHVRFFTFNTAKKLLQAGGCQVEVVDCTPFLVRAFLPLIKKILGRRDETSNVKSMIDSPQYQFYQKYMYPIEYWITRVRPSLFAFRMILVARKSK